MKNVNSFVFALLLLFPFSCSDSRGNMDTIVGKWQGDPDNAKTDPAIKKEAENNPMGDFFLQAMEEFYKTLEVDITKNTISIESQIPGEESRSEVIQYKMISASKDTVTIKGTTEGEGSRTLVIRISDRDHIKIVAEKTDDSEPAFILKRLQ
jgi:hypothetical protein